MVSSKGARVCKISRKTPVKPISNLKATRNVHVSLRGHFVLFQTLICFLTAVKVIWSVEPKFFNFCNLPRKAVRDIALKTNEVSAKIANNYMLVCTHAVKSRVVLFLNQSVCIAYSNKRFSWRG